MMTLIVVKKRISRFNFKKSTIDRLKGGYIVIHYVGAIGGAEANCNYYGSAEVGASAHYFVDHNGDIYQCVEDENVAYHCGASSYKHPECRNTNAIGIELCCRTTGDPKIADDKWYFEDATVEGAIKLVKEKMQQYNIPADHVIRHYDVTGKTCPAPYVYNNGKHTWTQFKAAISDTSEIQNGTKSQEDVTTIGWNAFITAGFPPVSAAAFLGHLKAESALRANNLQDTSEKILDMNDITYTASVDSKVYTKDQFCGDNAGYGLAQWTFWSRKKAMYEYIVEQRGKSIGDAEAQISFMLFELATDYPKLVEQLKRCKTVREASDLILTKYEQPGDQSEAVKGLRAGYGQEFYDKFAGSASGVPFMVKVDATDLRIRKGPGTNYAKTGKHTGKGTFTIVEVSNGEGSKNGWGLLKSYQRDRDGWISLDYAKRV